ncbi:MAG: HAMP domain-containing histidine kinase [Melioribacteraceae bacterium]|nr:HAMP domain-containing histidine kinase [Melioribacteraceae bacterium]MCF8353599.1 HAMP domain-containing histidine kinase [Melioribacteraceae bacterium]MCF8393522.1 HAMP domain-containing histidine kinase [Melioribacteraceae bacterium]MCF8419332.1 HAMP domain-containing histidine kinase [Melioribacteraceae bacterium]
MKDFFNSLFWKISATFLLILLIISAVYMYISIFTAEMYFQETRQKLDINIAEHIAKENDCFSGDSVNSRVLEQVFYNVMVINPSIEVYLLDTEGKILTYYAPDKIIKINNVPLEPIYEFINADDETFVMGIDPKNPKQEKAFSAAKVIEDGLMKGYIYVILGGEEYENASQLVFGSYILRLGIRSMVIALVMAAIIGFIAIGYITRNMRRITSVIHDFKKGNLNARIKLKGKGELSEFGDAFNEMADTIVSSIEEIKNMDTLRRELIANVSHDLRTPLAVLHGYIETVLIKSDSLSQEDKQQYMETILSNTKRLLSLVEELFELSKLEAKQIEPKREVFSLAELAQDIHQKNMIIAEEKKIELLLEIDDKLPMVNADIGMVEKVYQNLIDNAFKFTPEGETITIRLTNNNGRIKTEISDTGQGISKDNLPFIFDRYHKNKRTSDQKNKGLGLGLAIVNKILELHNVKIIVESEEGKGTTFSFEMPAHQ